jgi:hypothetical protein
MYLIFISFVLVLLYFILISINKKKKESFSNNNPNIILLGDSIFRNNNYVGQKNSIDNLLKVNHIPVLNLSQDGALISDGYYQIDKIPNDYNNKETTIIVSLGGNDLINWATNNQIENNQQLRKEEITHINYNLFIDYKNLIEDLHSKYDKCKIILTNLYYPRDPQWKSYFPIIKDWNHQLYDFYKSKDYNIKNILEIDKTINQPNDFVYSVEPSELGGSKIVHMISNIYYQS